MAHNLKELRDTIKICSLEKLNQSIPPSKPKVIQNCVQDIKSIVKQLENSLTKSNFNDQHLLIQLRMDEGKKQRITSQLETARKENKQLLNIIQQSCQHGCKSSRLQLDDTTYSTISMVNLQYKHEELLSSYESLLKIMAIRDKDLQNLRDENESLKDEIGGLHVKIQNCEHIINNLCNKYLTLKQRNNTKIINLKKEKETLGQAHDKLVKILHLEFMKTENYLDQKLSTTLISNKALLLQEVRRSNKLKHENMVLKQEITYLKANLNFPKLKNELP